MFALILKRPLQTRLLLGALVAGAVPHYSSSNTAC